MEDQTTQNPIQSPVPNPIPVVPQPKKSNLSIILFSILILILLGSTGYLYYQSQQLKSMLASYQTPVPTTSPTPTAVAIASATPDITGWKVYTNNAYGFSLRYPESAKLGQTNLMGTKMGFVLNNLTKAQDTYLALYVTANSWYFDDAKTIGTLNSTLDNVQVYKYTKHNSYTQPTETETIIDAKHGSNYITIDLLKDDYDKEADQIFDQILSTFKFTSIASATPSTLDAAKAACISQFGSLKYWLDAYNECQYSPDVGPEWVQKMQTFCTTYKGKLDLQASTCRHTAPGDPCGPEAVMICSF